MSSVVFLFFLFLCYIFINKVELEISVCVTTTSWRRGWDRSAENTGFDHFDDTFGILIASTLSRCDLDFGYRRSKSSYYD